MNFLNWKRQHFKRNNWYTCSCRDKFRSQISLDALQDTKLLTLKELITQHWLIYLLSKVYINLIDQKEPTLDFTNQDYEKDYSKANLNYYKKVIKPSENELKTIGNILKIA